MKTQLGCEFFLVERKNTEKLNIFYADAGIDQNGFSLLFSSSLRNVSYIINS